MADEKQQIATKDNEQKEQPVEAILVPAVSEDASDASAELVAEEADPVSTDEISESSIQEGDEDQQMANQDPVIKIETAPADFRFPTTNQSRHCFTRYVEYHRCIAVRGEAATECEKYAKYYRSLCPGEWIFSVESYDCTRYNRHFDYHAHAYPIACGMNKEKMGHFRGRYRWYKPSHAPCSLAPVEPVAA